MNDNAEKHTHHDEYNSSHENSSITSKFFAPFVVLVLLLGVFFTVQQIQKQQDTRSRAQLTQGVRLYMQPETGGTTLNPNTPAFYVNVLMDSRTVQNITAAELHVKSSDTNKLTVQEIQIGSALPQKLPPSAGNLGTVTSGVANLIVGSGCPGSTTALCTENGQTALMGQPKSGTGLVLAKVKVQPAANGTGTVNLTFDQACALNSVCTGNNTQVAAKDANGNVVAPADAQALTFTFAAGATNTPTNTPTPVTGSTERFLRANFAPQPDSQTSSDAIAVISRDNTKAKIRVVLNLPSTTANVSSVKIQRVSNNSDVATLTATKVPDTGIWRVQDQEVTFTTNFTANDLRAGAYKIVATTSGLSTNSFSAPLAVLTRTKGDIDGNAVLNVTDYSQIVSELGKPRGNYFSDVIVVTSDGSITDVVNAADYNNVIQGFTAAQ